MTPGGHGYNSLEIKTRHPEITELRPVLKAYVEEFNGSGRIFSVHNMSTMSTSTTVSITDLKPLTMYYVSFEIHLYLKTHFAEPIKSCDSSTGCIGKK